MDGIATIKDFYKSLNHTIYEHVIQHGHFDITKVEDLPALNGEDAPYFRHAYYKISLVFSHSNIHYPDVSFTLNGATLVFCSPYKSYQWERINGDQRGYVCIFTKDFLMQTADPEDFGFYQSSAYSVISLDDAAAAELEKEFGRMIEELRESYHLKYDLLKFMLLEMLHRAQKKLPLEIDAGQGSNANERITIAFFKLLEQKFPVLNNSQIPASMSPAHFADALHIHINHLNKVLRSFTGNTTSELITKRVILEAKNLLMSTQWSVNEIAWALGFASPNHFSVYFKRHTGTAPAQYRRKMD